MADEVKPVEPSTVATTIATQSTSTTTGPAVQAPPPAVVADDAIRKILGRYIILSDTITCLSVLYFLFSFGPTIPKDVLAIIATIAGGIIGYRARDTGTVIGYEFGSSSGSTAKSAAAMENK